MRLILPFALLTVFVGSVALVGIPTEEEEPCLVG